MRVRIKIRKRKEKRLTFDGPGVGKRVATDEFFEFLGGKHLETIDRKDCKPKTKEERISN